MECTSYIK
jgi:hypothetical protein